MKTCSKCRRVLPLDQFHKRSDSPDGYRARCTRCPGAAPIVPEVPPVQHVTPKETLEVARLKQELAHAKSLTKEYEKLALTGESLREMLGTLNAPNIQPDPDWLRGANSPKGNTGTPVLFISDIHFDEVVRSEQVGGCNEYNREIATKRLQNTFRAAIRLLKGHMARPSYDGIVCPLGGDLLSGNIHEEFVKTNEAPILVSMEALTPILIEGLGGLADEFGKVHVPCVTGNHGRMSRKPEAKNRAWENFEWSIYQRLVSYFKTDSRLTFDVPEGPDTYFHVYKKRYMLTHGDQFRGGGGIGGILVPILRGLSKKQVREHAIGGGFDTMIIGHFHQLIMLENLIVNGSVKGLDEYAYQGNFAYEPAQQALWVDHSDVGTTARWPIRCAYGI